MKTLIAFGWLTLAAVSNGSSSNAGMLEGDVVQLEPVNTSLGGDSCSSSCECHWNAEGKVDSYSCNGGPLITK